MMENLLCIVQYDDVYKRVQRYKELMLDIIERVNNLENTKFSIAEFSSLYYDVHVSSSIVHKFEALVKMVKYFTEECVLNMDYDDDHEFFSETPIVHNVKLVRNNCQSLIKLFIKFCKSNRQLKNLRLNAFSLNNVYRNSLSEEDKRSLISAMPQQGKTFACVASQIFYLLCGFTSINCIYNAYHSGSPQIL